jgi:hypothetical protein
LIARLWTLLLKELRQNTVVLAVAALGLPIAWLFFMLGAFGAAATVSYMEIHANFLRFAFVPFAFAVGNRLVVTELYGRTQRFLEGLPMGRFEPAFVKWTLGAAILLGVSVSSLVVSLAVASLREPIDAGFATSLGARTLVFTITLWSFLFMMGQLGKLRVPLYLVLGLVLIILASTTELELMRFGPFALVGQDLALSREGVPWAESATSLAIAAACLAVTVALAFVREGGVQETLSKPMSSRERAMVGIATCTILIVWTGLQPEAEPMPYQMSGEHVLRARSVPLVIGYGSEAGRADAERLLARLEPSLVALMPAMGWTALPEARVVLRGSLDGRTFENAALRAGDGALVRANFRETASPDLEGLEAALVRGLLDDRTNHRADFEPQAWARSGFPLWWAHCGPHRTPPTAPALGPCTLSASRRALAQLALHASPEGGRGVDRARIAAWSRLREEENDRVAESLAGTGMVTLARLTGGAGPTQLANALFSRWVPDDSRVVLTTLLSPLPSRLRDATGVELDGLHAEWQADLVRDRSAPEVATLLGRVSPRPTATFTIAAREGSLRTLVFDVTVPWARTEGVIVTVLTRVLAPFDTRVEAPDLRRDQFVLEAGAGTSVGGGASAGAPVTRHIELTGRVSAGDRILVLVEVEDPASGLGAPTRILAERRVVE